MQLELHRLPLDTMTDDQGGKNSSIFSLTAICLGAIFKNFGRCSVNSGE